MKTQHTSAGWLASLAAACFFASIEPAHAQLPPVTTGYTFTLPVVKVLPNPCTGSFVLISGSTTVGVTTSTGSDFWLGITFTSDGRGEDALADGTIISDGSQGPMYLYSSVTQGDTYFPDGTPGHYLLSLPIAEHLVRAAADSTGDAFMLTTQIELTFSNGIPLAPVLKSLDVSCK